MSRAVFVCVCVFMSYGVGVDALKLPAAAPAAPASRRRLLAGAPAVAAAALVGGAGAAVAGVEADFKAADADRNGRLSRGEFERWYAGDARLTRRAPVPGPSLSLPEIALDVTGVSGIIAAIYAGSYAYYLTRQMAEKDAKAAKQKARDAQVKKADAAKAKAEAAAAAAAGAAP